MVTARITWQDLQQAPDDGKRREAIGGGLYVTPAPSVRQGVRDYWIVDHGEDAVEVWTFDEESSGQERFTGSLPVRFRGDVVGEIDLDRVFRRGV